MRNFEFRNWHAIAILVAIVLLIVFVVRRTPSVVQIEPSNFRNFDQYGFHLFDYQMETGSCLIAVTDPDVYNNRGVAVTCIPTFDVEQ